METLVRLNGCGRGNAGGIAAPIKTGADGAGRWAPTER